MKTLTKEEVKKIVENHEHWVNKDCRDWRDMKADFTDVYIGHMDLSGVNLSEATFDRAIFDSVDLTGANLSEVDIRNCMFVNTNLEDAALRSSNISHTKFNELSMAEADFTSSNISHTKFNELSMAEADFTYSHILMSEFSFVGMRNSKFIDATMHLLSICDCYMFGADFNRARITDSDFDFNDGILAKNWPFVPPICPETGSFIGWKKVYDKAGYHKIVCLEIQADAKRSSGFGRKCRCDKAKVIGIYNTDGSPYDGEVHSMWDPSFVYRVGQMLTVDNFDDDRFKECAPGIHFFITRQEALDFVF